MELFWLFSPNRLAAEVLYDSLRALILAKSDFSGLPVGTRAVCLPDNSYNSSNYFLSVFGRPDSSSACECERSQEASLAQSLHLFNAKNILLQWLKKMPLTIVKLERKEGRLFIFMQFWSRSHLNKLDQLTPQDFYYLGLS